MGGSCFEQLGEQPAQCDRELAELDNFWPICDMPSSTKKGATGDGEFTLDGKAWPTAEHYFQAAKFAHDAEYQELIRTSATCMGPEGCFNLGRHGKMAMSQKEWDAMSLDVMYKCNLAKFAQNPHLREVLCSTAGRIRAQGDASTWATWNAILLERIREELKEPSERDEEVLRIRVEIMDALSAAAASGDKRVQQAAAKAAQRRVLPLQEQQQYTLAGFNTDEHEWIGNGKFRVDPLEPELNGQPHLINSLGEVKAHIFLGCKNGTFKWILDEDCSPKEIGGAITFAVSPGGSRELPIGQKIWAAPWSNTKEVPLVLTVSSTGA